MKRPKRKKRSAVRLAQSVIVEVPGTTANMGTGFDVLGMALDLSNRCRVRRNPGQSFEWKGATAPALAMMRSAAAAFFKKAGRKPFGFSLDVGGQVPIARGLGSSVTVRLGIIAGLNHLCGSPLEKSDMLGLVSQLEGHPDNATPAVFGGLAVSTIEGKGGEARVRHVRFPVDQSLKFLLIIPETRLETEKARKVLPRSYLREDAVHNLGRACLLTAAMTSKRYDLLWCGTDDRLHQPYRACLLRPLYPILKAARKSGALGGWLSGSGSTVCIVVKGGAEKIVRAVQRVMPRSMRWAWHVVRADNHGFRIL